MSEPEHWLLDENLTWADVLVYWSHKHSFDILEKTVRRVQHHVMNGLDLIAKDVKDCHRLLGKLILLM